MTLADAITALEFEHFRKSDVCAVEGFPCAICAVIHAYNESLDARRAARTDDARLDHLEAEVATMRVEVDALNAAVFVCKRCGNPRLSWQVYCGAACSQLAEAGK